MVQTENNTVPPPTFIQPQNEEEEDVDDSEFEESDKEEEYMSRHMNDPTTSWQGFHESCFTNLRTKHIENDEYDSDYICSESSEDKDEPLATRVRGGRRHYEFNKVVDMRDPKFMIGMVFSTCNCFKRALKEYSIVKHRTVRLVKNDKGTVMAKCHDSCPWMVYTSVESDGFSFKVKTINDEHTCGLDFSTKKISS